MKSKVPVLILLLSLTLLGCSENESSTASGKASSESSSESTQFDDVGPYGPSLGKADVVRSVRIRTTGGHTQEISGKNGDGKTGLTGRCNPTMFANFGIEIGESMGGSRVAFAFATTNPIATGQTGEIGLEWVMFEWARAEGAEFESKSFKGEGTLTLTTHDASAGSRRMTGTLIGKDLAPMYGQSGAPVQLEAKFDMDFSCGVR